ncbi:MAG: putative Na+/H+ antiporter, partial [Pseudomonadota bacterium]
RFEDNNINPGALFLGALLPTIVTILCFQLLPMSL